MATKKEKIAFLLENNVITDGLTTKEINEIYNGLLIKIKETETTETETTETETTETETTETETTETETTETETTETETTETETTETETTETETKTENNKDFDFDSIKELENKIAASKTPVNSGVKTEKKIVERKTKKIPKKESNPDSFRMEGYILLLMVDTAFPFAFSILHNMFEKRFKVNTSDLCLRDKQFSKLEPLADQAADYMSVNLNPIMGFMLVSAFMYGNNLIMLRSKIISELPQK